LRNGTKRINIQIPQFDAAVIFHCIMSSRYAGWRASCSRSSSLYKYHWK
jgi:hypothetical protein